MLLVSSRQDPAEGHFMIFFSVRHNQSKPRGTGPVLLEKYLALQTDLKLVLLSRFIFISIEISSPQQILP